MSRALKLRTGRRGIALVYIALILLVLVGVLGLAIDTGYVFLTAHQLQNAADAAALAGADMVAFDTNQASTDAVNEAAQNNAAHVAVTLTAATDVFVGNYNRTTATFTANTSPYNACKVIARRTTGSANGPVSLFFAPIFGITTSEVSRQAIAMNNALGAAVLLLSKTASPALQLTGSGSNKDKIIATNGGAVYIDSSSSTAVQWTGNPYITAAALDIVGNDTAVSSGGVFPSGTLNVNAPSMADPLASLAAPSQGTTQTQPPSGGTFQPGYYPNGITVGGTLSAGIYYVDNGISLNGNDALTGTGVMIYLNSGGISLKGNTTIDITSPTSGTYAGISYFEARNNTSSIELRGTSGSSDTGTMYFPAGDVTIHGTPNSFANQLIANTLTVAGDGQLNIAYDGRNATYRHMAFIVN